MRGTFRSHFHLKIKILKQKYVQNLLEKRPTKSHQSTDSETCPSPIQVPQSCSNDPDLTMDPDVSKDGSFNSGDDFSLPQPKQPCFRLATFQGPPAKKNVEKLCGLQR